MYKKIHLDAPNIGELEKKYLNKAIDSRYVSAVGPFVSEFEKKFAHFLGVKYAVATQSGTAAIHLSLVELRIGPGDEVIVPALTFVATVNPVIYVGAKPVFVDVDIQTWNIDPSGIEKKITKKTKAIIPVHLYGNPCNMSEILKIARRHHLCVIEDATESLGSKYNGKFTGTLGDLGCFSFNGNKIITTGSGGMVVGNNGIKLKHIKYLSNQARDTPEEYYHSEVGFNYQMTNIESALGLAQLERLDEFILKKKKFHNIYKEELKQIKCIRFQAECDGASPLYWLTGISLDDNIDIAKLQKSLKKVGIRVRRIFMPLIEFPPYAKFVKGSFQNAYHIYETGLCLPSSTLNSRGSIHYICKKIKELLN